VELYPEMSVVVPNAGVGELICTLA
jgi:hypothetical protein